MGAKVWAADHKLLETQPAPPTLPGDATGRAAGILTPMVTGRFPPDYTDAVPMGVFRVPLGNLCLF